MNCLNKQQAAGWAKTNTKDTIWKRAGKRLSLTRGPGLDGCIHELLQEIAAQVCTKHMIKCNSYEKGRLGCYELPVQCCSCLIYSLLVFTHYSYYVQTDISFSRLIVYFSAG